jgi:hypothetical protein
MEGNWTGEAKRKPSLSIIKGIVIQKTKLLSVKTRITRIFFFGNYLDLGRWAINPLKVMVLESRFERPSPGPQIGAAPGCKNLVPEISRDFVILGMSSYFKIVYCLGTKYFVT